MIPELPALVLGLWCGVVRWEYEPDVLIYSRGGCLAGDNFLQVEKHQLRSPRATCEVSKVVRLGDNRWVSSGEMVYSAWGNCKDDQTTWQQKVTLLENNYLKARSDWLLYEPNYKGHGRSLLQW
jgi:hypothetical protein